MEAAARLPYQVQEEHLRLPEPVLLAEPQELILLPLPMQQDKPEAATSP